MQKIKEKINAINSLGKFDIELISKKYKFDKNYLIKMKDEMAIFREGYIKYYFNVGEDYSPFLLNASEKNPNKNDELSHIVPLSQDIKDRIYQCIYIIYQELIGYQNENNFEQNSKSISPVRRFKYDDNEERLFRLKRNYSFSNNNINELILKKEYSKTFYNDTKGLNISFNEKKKRICSGINITASNKILKNFEKFNLNNNTDIINIKTKFKNDKNQNIDNNINMNQSLDESNKKIMNENKNNKTRNVIDEKTNNEYNSNDLNVIKPPSKNNDVNNIKELFQDKNEQNNINNNNNIKNNIDNNKNEESINDKKDIKEKIDNVTSSPNHEMKSNNILLSPSNKKKNYKVKTLTKEYSKFSKDYTDYYYKLIPQEIKDMFKIEENISINYLKGISPYILISYDGNGTDNDSPNINNILGICIISFQYRKGKLQIIINHRSTLIQLDNLKKIKYIFFSIIKYLKNEFYYDEIIIEYNNKKVVMEILNIFLDDLNFIVDNEENDNKFKDKKDIESSQNEEMRIIYTDSVKKINDAIRQEGLFYYGKTILNIFDSLVITNNSNYKMRMERQNMNKTNIDFNKHNKMNYNMIDEHYINIYSMNYLLEISKNTNINLLYNKISKLDQLLKIFQKNNINKKEIPITIAENRYDILSCVTNTTSINNSINNYSIYNNYNLNNPVSYVDEKTKIFYNFIKPENVYIISSQNYNISFYHIIMNNLSLFFCNLTKELSDFLEKDNIYNQINEVYRNTLKENRKETLINKILWIPCFDISNHFQCLSKNGAGNLNEYIKFSNKPITQIIHKDFKINDTIQYLRMEPDETKDIIFDNDFICGLINNSKNIFEMNFTNGDKTDKSDESSTEKNINDINMPYIVFMSFIHKNNFIKSNPNYFI